MNPAVRLLLFGGRTPDRDWAARVSANGGSVSAGTLSAVAAFVVACQSTGVWTKLNRVNLFCGDQLAAALVPLKVGGGSPTDTNTNFVSGDYTEATGLTGNGTSKYLSTGIAQNMFSAGDRHLSAYERVRGASIGADSIGAEAGSGSQVWSLGCGSAATTELYAASSNGGGVSVASEAAGGHYIGVNPTGASSILYKAGASVASGAVSAATPTSDILLVLAGSRAGVPLHFSAAVLGGYSIGSALSAADAANYYTAMQAFQTALGRNV